MKFGISIGYSSKLNSYETIDAINIIKDNLQFKLKENFKLVNFDCALATNKKLWLNDDSKTTERSLDFEIANDNFFGEILISPNKWRRYFLYLNKFNEDEGVLNVFRCIKRDTNISNSGSISYEEIGFDIIKKAYDQNEVTNMLITIYRILKQIDLEVSLKYKVLDERHISRKLSFINYKNLKIKYPLLNFSERIDMFGREYGSFVLTDFVMHTINNNHVKQYSNDVFNFNSVNHLYVYNSYLNHSILVAYSGYQVDRATLRDQNIIFKEGWKINTEYDNLIKGNNLPLTISTGILINNVLLQFLEKQHIAEVHSSVWSDEFVGYCKKNNINIF